jgi:hypothetical protein
MTHFIDSAHGRRAGRNPEEIPRFKELNQLLRGTVPPREFFQNVKADFACPIADRFSPIEKERICRTPDVGPQFQPGGENGLSHSFRWRELRGWGRRAPPAPPAGSLQIPRHQEF